MTRETKVGLIVASSFLGLVGVVVAARLARTEDSSRPDNIRAAISPVTEKKEQKPEPAKNEPVAVKEDKNAPGILPITLKGDTISEPTPKVAPAFPPDAPPVDPGPPPVRSSKDPPPAFTSVEITEQEQKRQLEALAAEVKKSVPVTDQVASLDSKKPTGTPEPPPLANPKDKTPPAPPAVPSAFSDTAPAAPPKQETVSPPPAPPPSAPAITPPTSGFGPSPTAPKPADPPSPPPPPVSPASAPTPAALAGNSGSGFPGAEQKPLTPPPSPADPKPSANLTGSGFPASDSKPPVVGKPPETAPIPTPPPAAPPIGERPTSSSPPITVNPSPAKQNPKVVSYDVETYVVKPDDKSFASISQRIYNTDKYGKALAQFNKNYPLTADALKQDSPLLQAGQQVYFPPIHVLESTYPWAIGESASAPPPPPVSSGGNNVGVPPGSPISVGPPAAISSTPGNPTAVAAPPPGTRVQTAVSTNPDNTRNYTVRDGGEHILEIARTVLRNPQRWAEIYRLNPSVRPEYPIPGGTVLKLPAT